MEFKHEEGRIYCQDEDGKVIAEIVFPNKDQGTVDINRTFVDSSLRGQGVADKLMTAAVEDIKARNLKTVATCSYAAKWFAAHPEQCSLLAN